MNTISISDIQRNLHKLENFDIVEIVDKKRNQIKGYFLDKKYVDVVEKLVKSNTHKNKSKLDALKAMGSYGLGGKNIRDIKAEIYDNQ
ncbi:MAG: hypothetical protein Q9M39_03475 [Sulfurovum sp.]|nr:hypothetical protein [Sulfurovum sp.]